MADFCALRDRGFNGRKIIDEGVNIALKMRVRCGSCVIIVISFIMLNLFQHNEQTSPVILKQPIVMLNLFQHNAQPSPVILKQVQDDDGCGR